jgi:hypothetical protein
MAVTLAIFAAVQVVMPLWVRPHLIPPSQLIATTQATQATLNGFHGGTALTASIVPGQPDAWVISSGGVNAAGHGQPRLAGWSPSKRTVLVDSHHTWW